MNIVAVNIKQGGGLTILNQILYELKVKKIKCNIYVDHNFKTKNFISNNFKFYKINGLLSKILIYGKKLDNVLYLGNIPPYSFFGKQRLLFFQNMFILKDYSFLLRQRMFKIIFLKFYVNLFINNVDKIFVESNYVSKVFKKILNKDSIIAPVFDESIIKKKYKLKYDLCYIALPNPNKNFSLLFKTLSRIKEKNIDLKLALTIPKSQNLLIKEIQNFRNSSIKIFNFGMVSRRNALRIIDESNALVFPSKIETFGLPLVEAALRQKIIISSDLPYVFDVVKPSAVFDPDDMIALENLILKSLENKLPLSKVIAKNKLESILSNLNLKINE